MPDDIVDALVASARTDTLVEAIKAADLAETLSKEGPFTVFAPVDDAFTELGADMLEALLADKEALTTVLTYHVVSGVYLAEDVVDAGRLTTLQGEDLMIMESPDDGVLVDEAAIIQADIVVENGVIHLIDLVLKPEAVQIVDVDDDSFDEVIVEEVVWTEA